MKKHWKKILALSLAVVVLLTGGLFTWQWKNWFGGAGEPTPPGEPDGLSAPEYPSPQPLEFAPPDPDAPQVQNYGPDPADFAQDAATGAAFVKNIVVVMFARDASEAQKQAALAASGGEIAGRADMISKWQLRVPVPDYAGLTALCGRLKAMPGVTAAMPDHVVEAVTQALPSADPWPNGTQWADILRLPETWAAFNSLTASPAVLGMVDTGVLASHEELLGIVQNLTTVDGFTQPAYSYAVTPAQHGTAMAGVMAARANNNKGSAGVAWNAVVHAVDYASAKSASGFTTEQVLYDGILAVVRKNAKAVNFSIGIISDANPNGTAMPDAHGYAAGQNMWQMIIHGYDFVLVQSAGNKNVESKFNGFFASVTAENCGLPAADAEKVLARIIIAGSLYRSGGSYAQVDYSAYGGLQQIFAPGVSIPVPVNNSNSAYQNLSGTSLAAPQVTATAGWMLAFNPALNAGQVGTLLKRAEISPDAVTPVKAGEDNYRMLDTRRALESARTPLLLSSRADVIISADGLYVLVPEKTAAADIAAALSSPNSALAYAKAQTDRLAGTGDMVWAKVPGAAGREVAYTLVVKGDLSGDGRVDALDAQCLLGLPEGTWSHSYSPEIYTLALDGMTADQLFDRGME